MPDVNKKSDAAAAKERSFSVSSNGKTSRSSDAWNIRIPKVRAPQAPRFDFNGVSRRRAGALGLLAALLIGLLAGFAGGYWGAGVRADRGTLGNSLSAQRKVVTSQSQLISQIAKTVGPSVVSVDVISQTAPTDTGLNSIFGLDSGASQQKSAGTGIIISDDGLIITNRHVVPAGTTSVSVTLADGTELKNVQVLGRTSDNDSLDIAFLKITDAKDHKLTPATLGDSSQLQVNLNGQVIGINTAIAGNAENIGFAIPINDVTGLIKQMQKTGKLERPYLGVRYVALTPDVADQYDIDATNGAFILPATDSASPSVLSGSPAEEAGLHEGDVITRIDDTKIDQTHSLTSIISKHDVGDQVSLTVLRDGKTIHATATLQALPSS
jgi:S1-C subfamily serine protease